MTHMHQWDGPGVSTEPRDRLHHSSHRALLRDLPETVNPRGIDAIIVPTARRPAALIPAFRLAGELRCEVLVLCSRNADRVAAVKLAEQAGVHAVAVDTGHTLPHFPLRSADVPTDVRSIDLSSKRNIGLLTAHVSGRWQRVLFLDDDIVIHDPEHVRAAGGHLGRNGVTTVGIDISHFPDNSVVCHAHRAVGGPQETFIGGGALAIVVSRADGFFPHIYNEDWLFLYDLLTENAVGHLGTASQSAYQPFADPRRAHDQEFGDCIAEGLFALLDDGRGAAAAENPDYWCDVLRRRADFIESIRRDNSRPDIEAALLAAGDALRAVTPDLCVGFMRAWRADLEQWRRFRESLSPDLGVIGGLAKLGVVEVARTAGFPP